MARKNDPNGVWNIPNALSVLRLCMLPVIVWLYVEKGRYRWAGWMLVLSGLTDIADGYVARHYHMISNVGKVLDPIADKLTQAVMLGCLMARYPDIVWPLALMVVKEAFMIVSGILVIKRTGTVPGANWHGKAATLLLYATMLLHVFWADISHRVSRGSIAVCTCMILLSLMLYGVRNIQMLRDSKPAPKGDLRV